MTGFDSALGTLKTMWLDMSKSFVGTLNDMYPTDGGASESGPALKTALLKDQRYMHLALIFLAFLLLTQLLEQV